MRWRGLARITVGVVIVLTLPTPLLAAFEYSHGSGVSESLAGAIDLFAAAPLDCSHQPALSAERSLEFEASASRLFNFSDFSLSCGAVRLSVGSLSFGLGTTQLTGSDFYRERSYLLNSAYIVARDVSLGANLSYRQLSYAYGYRDLNSTSLSVGLHWQAAPNLRLAASLLDLNKPRFYADGESTPMTGVVSAASEFSGDLAWFFTYRIISDLPDRFSLGQRWALHERVSLRLGIRNQPLDICGGLSVRLGGFSFDYTYTNNVYLGSTHMLGLRYER